MASGECSHAASQVCFLINTEPVDVDNDLYPQAILLLFIVQIKASLSSLMCCPKVGAL